jgi:hypothetical protein
MRFEEMKVAELKQESRNRGLTLESKGHKFTKQELIDRLNAYENETNEAWIETKSKTKVEKQTAPSNEDDESWVETKGFETETLETEEVKTSPEETEERKFATLEEIEMKYCSRKEQRIYDNVLQVGCMICYVRFIETKHGKLLKKLGSAKVVGVNRKKELVRVQTPVGEEKELTFDELVFIRDVNVRTYPKDINSVLYAQRQAVKEYKERTGQKNEYSTDRTER